MGDEKIVSVLKIEICSCELRYIFNKNRHPLPEPNEIRSIANFKKEQLPEQGYCSFLLRIISLLISLSNSVTWFR